jgi:hypothetical protein
MISFEDCIVFLLAKAYQRAHGNLRRHPLPYELTPVQHLILETLWEIAPMRRNACLIRADTGVGEKPDRRNQ